MGSINDADRTNNVEQVAVSYLPAGEISIEVTAPCFSDMSQTCPQFNVSWCLPLM